jgi:tetratricopeptide (TPR) repeat protein
MMKNKKEVNEFPDFESVTFKIKCNYRLRNWVIIIFLFLIQSCNGFIPSGDTLIAKRLTEKGEQLLNSKPDSVLKLTDSVIRISLKTSLDDQLLVRAYAVRQKAFSKLKNMDSVIAVGSELRVIAERIPDSLSMANSLLLVKGEVDYNEQQKLLKYLPGGIFTFGKANKNYEKAQLLGSYGVILSQKGDFKQAQTLLFQAYKIYQYLDSLKAMWSVCLNIGSVYLFIGSTKEEIEYYKKAYDIAIKRNDSLQISSSLINISGYFNDIKNYDSASYYINESLKILPPSPAYHYLKMKIDYKVADIQTNKGNYTVAESFFNSMLNNCKRDGAIEGIAMAYKGLGTVYNKTNRPKLAIDCLTKAIKIADTMGQGNLKQMLWPILINTYKSSGDYKNAYEAVMINNALNDSLMALDKQVAIHDLEKGYQSEKKELENKRLTVELSSKKKIIFLLMLIFVILILLWRIRERWHKQLATTQNVLIAKYKAEKLERDQLKNKNIEIEPIIQSAIVTASEVEISLFEKLNNYYREQKPYKNAKLKIADIVVVLNTTQNEIAQELKANNYPNFNAFTNYYRVEEARRMFEEEASSNLKLEIIGEQSGFGSKQSFYTAFESVTGIKPGFYRNSFMRTG